MRLRQLIPLLLLVGCGEGPPLASELAKYRAEYEARWGAVDLTDWTIEVVPVSQAPVLGSYARAGLTDWKAKHVTIVEGYFEAFPHELHHVARGPTSYAHAGWCAEGFGQWEVDALDFDERAYLGCP